MLNKLIITLLTIFIATGLNAQSRLSITGCDIDQDSVEDKVTAIRCKVKSSTEQLVCKKIKYRLSGSENRKATVKLKESKRKARRQYSDLTCDISTILAGATEDEIAEFSDKEGQNHNIWGRNRRGKIQKVKGVDREISESGLTKVCRGVRPLRSCEVWKSAASGHFPNSDPRKFSSSLIALRGCPGSFNGCITAYDKNGNKVHTLGEYPNSIGAYDSRHYGGYGCGDRKTPDAVGKEALRNTGSQEIYLKDDQGICVRVPNADRCCFSSECGTGPGCGSL